MFNIEAVEKALNTGKLKPSPRAVISKGVVDQKVETQEKSIQSDFEALKQASVRSQRVFKRREVPAEFASIEGKKSVFRIAYGSTEMDVVATFLNPDKGVKALVVVQYKDMYKNTTESRFQLRAWHNYQDNWKISRVDALPESKGDLKSKCLVETLKSTTCDTYSITVLKGYTIKTRGRSVLDVVSRNVFWDLLEKKKGKPKK